MSTKQSKQYLDDKYDKQNHSGTPKNLPKLKTFIKKVIVYTYIKNSEK